MRRGVVPLGDVASILRTVTHGHHHVTDVDKLLVDVAEKAQPRLDLQVRVGGLDGGGDKRQVLPLGADVVRPGAPEDVHVRLPPGLFLREDDLHRVRIPAVGDGVAQDAQRPHHLSHPPGLPGEVAGIADDKLGTSRLAVGGDADRAARLVVRHRHVGLVEHVRATVHRGEAGETLGELAEAVEGVDVRGARVEAQQGLVVELHRHHHLTRGTVEVGIVRRERDGMTDEIDGARLEAEGGEKLAAGDHVEVMAFVGLRVVRVVIWT